MSRITANQLLTHPIRANWFVPGWLIAGQVNLLAGEVAAGKSFAALDLAIGAATRGTAWGGLPISPAKVLYLTLDTPLPIVAARLEAMARAEGLSDIPNLVFDDGFYDLGISDSFGRLAKEIKSEKYTFVIVDALGRYLTSGSENSVSRINGAFMAFNYFTLVMGATVVVVHHLNKGPSRPGDSIAQAGNRIRGSSSIFGSVDTAVLLTRIGRTRLLRSVKNRMGSEPPALRFQIEEGPGTIRLNFDLPPEAGVSGRVLDQVLARLVGILRAHPGQALTKAELIEEMGGNVPAERTFQRAVGMLEGFGVETGYRNRMKTFTLTREGG